jgi:hypothetical protein
MMNRSMRIVTLPLVLCVTVGLVLATAANVAHATPNRGDSCMNCHSNEEEGRMEVSGTEELLDLETQLDGNQRGPLKTFTVTPGDTVSLEMTVLDGSLHYAVQLKRLETGGQKYSQDNKLDWTDANGPENVWQEWGAPTYYTKGAGEAGTSGIPWDGTQMTYVFNMTLDAATPIDVYDLEFAVATGGFAYQDEHFYLNVVPEPSAVVLAGLGLLGLLAWRRRR